MPASRLRFGPFSFAPETGELHRGDVRVKLQGQPAKMLAALTRQPGEVVSREQLKTEIWGRDTHVDFERGLNFCIAQIRAALRDSAESPSYIETLPRQGYRFIAPVDAISEPRTVAGPVDAVENSPLNLRPASPWAGRGAAGLVIVSLIVIALIGWARASSGVPTIVVVPFYNETGVADGATLADAIGDATVARLAAPERIESLKVIGNAPALEHPFARQDVQRIARDLDAQWVLIGQLKTDGQKQRVIAHLIRAADMKHLWAQTFDEDAFDLAGQSRAAEGIASAVTGSLSTRRK
ncbi:MAG TPA: winged helix-turn-helix domain-containing protein [Vicinamibacterales bacterium]|nr:winged helix-turn-helix domain-containing protein [Vicinamibacterales bacterium]